MTLNIYQVDAFTNKLFGGNPAAVIPLENWLPDEVLQAIALENNLSETAFTVPKGDDFELRWFTPVAEVILCGHATLATSHIYFQELNYDKEVIRFHTKSGILSVKKEGDFYVMDFPADNLEVVEDTAFIQEALGVDKLEIVLKGREDYLAIVESQEVVEKLQPDFQKIATLGSRGFLVSARGKDTDFVSRCFFPQYGIDEDPVTGSAHTTMTPYWAKELNQNTLTARQLSQRVGDLICTLEDDRVILKGQAVLYLKGQIELA